MKYIIMKWTTTKDLAEEVNRKMEEWYAPTWWIVLLQWLVLQAMVKMA